MPPSASQYLSELPQTAFHTLPVYWAYGFSSYLRGAFSIVVLLAIVQVPSSIHRLYSFGTCCNNLFCFKVPSYIYLELNISDRLPFQLKL